MVFYPLVQRDAAQIGHHKIGGAIGFKQVGYFDDVGVVQPVKQLGFVEKAVQPQLKIS